MVFSKSCADLVAALNLSDNLLMAIAPAATVAPSGSNAFTTLVFSSAKLFNHISAPLPNVLPVKLKAFPKYFEVFSAASVPTDTTPANISSNAKPGVKKKVAA